jgi:hypothetical protein
VFNKDIKVPLQEAELVGTSSSNTGTGAAVAAAAWWQRQPGSVGDGR